MARAGTLEELGLVQAVGAEEFDRPVSDRLPLGVGHPQVLVEDGPPDSGENPRPHD